MISIADRRQDHFRETSLQCYIIDAPMNALELPSSF
jgi:hypothetical protein